MHDVSLLVKSILNKGNEAEHRGDFIVARQHFQSALDEARLINDKHGEAAALVSLAEFTGQIEGNLSKAYELLDQSLSICQQIGFDRGIASTMCALGSTTLHMGKFDESLQWMNKALVLFREMKDQTGEATVLHQMGLIQKKRIDHGSAEICWRQSLSLFEALGDKFSMGQVLLSLGNLVADYHKDLKQGRQLFTKALLLFDELGLPLEAKKARHNLAIIDRLES